MNFKNLTTVLTLVLFFSISSGASLDSKSWTLSKGRKHSKFVFGKTAKVLEKDVFSESVPFQERWSLVTKVAEMKSPKDAELFLVRCLDSNKWFLQSVALKELRKRNSDLALIHADKLLLKSKALVVRSEAVDIISELGSSKNTNSLWSSLKQRKNFMGSKSLWIRPQIVKTIFKLEGRQHSKKEWGYLLDDSDALIKEMAKRVHKTF